MNKLQFILDEDTTPLALVNFMICNMRFDYVQKFIVDYNIELKKQQKEVRVMNKNYKIKINAINIFDDVVYIRWSASIGFGELTINKCGSRFEIETEELGKEFYKQVLDKAKEYIFNNSIIIE